MHQHAHVAGGRHSSPANRGAAALMTRREVAEFTGFAEITLAVWAKSGRGPKVTRVENRPRYRVGDVLEWIEGAHA